VQEEKGLLPIGFSLFDNAISDTEKIISYLETQHWSRSEVIADDPISNTRTSSTQSFPLMSWDNPDVIEKMNKTVWSLMNEYAKSWNFPFQSIEPISVQKYEPGQKYDKHIDHSTGLSRILSAVVYLNTVSAGGETYFPRFNFSVKPFAGRVVLFPSNFIYEHEARPPLEGVKYAAAYWAVG
jgi:prolyl 4-hydroxylase